jgi:hypothetical protein
MSPLAIVVAIVGGIVWVLFGMDACITETRSTIAVGGLHFQIEETDCDTLAKDASISVYELSHDRPQKTLPFKYGPAYYDLPVPVVEMQGPRTIRITVPIVSDIVFQRSEWVGYSIEYNIGHIDHPRAKEQPRQ